MKILHISSANTFGGGERHLVDLCRELVIRGHEVYVALRPTNTWQAKLDFLPAENFLHVSIRNSFGMFSARHIGRFIDKHQIDIVHAHVARDYLAASVAVRSAGNGKLILTRHVVFPLKPFHRFALRNVEAAIAVSPVVAAQLERVFPSKKVITIANGIHMKDGSQDGDDLLAGDFRDLHGISHNDALVVTLGELRLLKGQRDLVLAANEVVKRFPNCHFIVAGEDNTLDKRFRRELKRLVKVFGLEEKFTWLDWLEDISPLIAAADIFVSPSHSESFGLAILDAMAAGTAVVATNTDGARELIPDLNALAPIKDPLALAERIIWYLENVDERVQLAKLLQATAVQKFGLDRMIDQTEDIYRRVLAGGL